MLLRSLFVLLSACFFVTSAFASSDDKGKGELEEIKGDRPFEVITKRFPHYSLRARLMCAGQYSHGIYLGVHFNPDEVHYACMRSLLHERFSSDLSLSISPLFWDISKLLSLSGISPDPESLDALLKKPLPSRSERIRNDNIAYVQAKLPHLTPEEVSEVISYVNEGDPHFPSSPWCFRFSFQRLVSAKVKEHELDLKKSIGKYPLKSEVLYGVERLGMHIDEAFKRAVGLSKSSPVASFSGLSQQEAMKIKAILENHPGMSAEDAIIAYFQDPSLGISQELRTLVSKEKNSFYVDFQSSPGLLWDCFLVFKHNLGGYVHLWRIKEELARFMEVNPGLSVPEGLRKYLIDKKNVPEKVAGKYLYAESYILEDIIKKYAPIHYGGSQFHVFQDGFLDRSPYFENNLKIIKNYALQLPAEAVMAMGELVVNMDLSQHPNLMKALLYVQLYRELNVGGWRPHNPGLIMQAIDRFSDPEQPYEEVVKNLRGSDKQTTVPVVERMKTYDGFLDCMDRHMVAFMKGYMARNQMPNLQEALAHYYTQDLGLPQELLQDTAEMREFKARAEKDLRDKVDQAIESLQKLEPEVKAKLKLYNAYDPIISIVSVDQRLVQVFNQFRWGHGIPHSVASQFMVAVAQGTQSYQDFYVESLWHVLRDSYPSLTEAECREALKLSCSQGVWDWKFKNDEYTLIDILHAYIRSKAGHSISPAILKRLLGKGKTLSETLEQGVPMMAHMSAMDAILKPFSLSTNVLSEIAEWAHDSGVSSQEAFRAYLDHHDILKPKSDIIYSSPELLRRYYDAASERIFKEPIYARQYHDAAFLAQNKSLARGALATCWGAHVLGASPANIRGQHGEAELDSLMKQSFSAAQIDFFVDYISLIKGGVFYLHDELVQSLHEMLLTYYTYAEPLALHACLPPHLAQPYLSLILDRFLKEHLESLPYAKALVDSELSARIHKFKTDYPYLSEEGIHRIVSRNTFCNEDLLKDSLLTLCNARPWPGYDRMDRNLLVIELAQWLEDHPGLSLEDSIKGFFDNQEQEIDELVAKNWGFSRGLCGMIVWRMTMFHHSLAACLSLHLRSHEAVIKGMPRQIPMDHKESEGFIDAVATLLADNRDSMSLEQAIRTQSRNWYEEKLEKQVRLPRPVLSAIARDMVEQDMTLAEAISQQMPRLLDVFHTAEGFTWPGVFKTVASSVFRLPFRAQDLRPLSVIFRGKPTERFVKLLIQGHSFAETMLELDRGFFMRTEGIAFEEGSHVGSIYAAIRLLNLPVEEFDLEPSEVANKMYALALAVTLAKEGWDDCKVFSCFPAELIARFRQVNNLVSLSVMALEKEHALKIQEGRDLARPRYEQYVASCFKLNGSRLQDPTWKFDGRNPMFVDMCASTINGFNCGYKHRGVNVEFFLNRLQLLTDPFYKPNDMDVLVLKDVSNAEYNAMRDTLIQLVQDHHKRQANLPRRGWGSGNGTESEQERIAEENRYKEYARQGITGFFRYWSNEGGGNLSSTHISERKRIIYVYRTLFEPLLKAGKFMDALDEVHNMAEVGHGCKPGCARCLVNMETRPLMVQMGSEMPTLQERLASVLRNLRLNCLSKVVNRNYGNAHNREDVDLFMKIACNHSLCLGFNQYEQESATCAQMYPDVFGKLVQWVLEEYGLSMIPEVMSCISKRLMPEGDRDGRTIYLEQIVDWAGRTPMYCNSLDIEEDLLEDGQVRVIAVQRLLRHSGYIDFVE